MNGGIQVTGPGFFALITLSTVKMKKIFGRESSHRVTPFPINIGPERAQFEDTSYLLHASERVGLARKLSQLHPSGESCDEKQREITSAAVLSLLCALDSCRGLDLSANGNKTSHTPGPKHQLDKPIYSVVGLDNGDGKVSTKLRNKEKDEKNILAELIGTKGPLTRASSAAAILAKARRVSEPVAEKQEQQHFSHLKRNETLHNFSREPSSTSDKQHISAEEIVHHLFQEYKTGKDNTQLLSDVLAYATPEQLEIEITRSFYNKCQVSQALVYAQIPWASAVADNARLVKNLRHNQDTAASQVTPQEALVAALIQSNEALCEALRVYSGLESVINRNDAEMPRQRDQEGHPPSSGMGFNEDLSLPTPPPSYEGPPNDELSSEGNTDNLAIYTEHPVSSSNLSDELEMLKPPHPSESQRLQVINEPQGDSSTYQLSGPSEPVESTIPLFKLDSLRSQASTLVISLPGSAQSTDYSSEMPITPEHTQVSNQLSHSGADMTEIRHDHESATSEPTILSPVHKELIVTVPDLTGKIIREGDYPAGRGGFADVWKCILSSSPDECNVAVKVLQSHIRDPSLEGKFAKRIRREILVWQRLNHENVLPLLGTVSHFGRYMSLVSPWMDNGSLMQYLQECGDDMGLVRRLQLTCEVAAGLTYLHSSQVVHGDLTGTNVLITDEGKACLCDFGLSSLMLEFHDTTFCTSTIGGNARWAAPEIYITVDDEVPSATTQSDVYSLGCIVLEILSGRVPYHYLPREGQVLLELQNGNKPRRPQDGHVSDILWNKINECWANPVKRPTSDNVAQFLTRQFAVEKSAALR